LPIADWSPSLRGAAPIPFESSYDPNKFIVGQPFLERDFFSSNTAYGAGKLISITPMYMSSSYVDPFQVRIRYSNNQGYTWQNINASIPNTNNVPCNNCNGSLFTSPSGWETFYLDDRFYSVSWNGHTIWSTNGTTWQASALDLDNATSMNMIQCGALNNSRPVGTYPTRKIITGNGYWIAFTACIARSQDRGVTWSIANNPSSEEMIDITFAAGLFTVITKNKIYQSSDATNWQLKFNLNDQAANFTNIEYGNGRFIVTSIFNDARNTAFYYSDDNGSTWSLLSSLSKKIDILSIKYGAGYWAAITNWQSRASFELPYSEGLALISSNRGLTWSYSSMPYNYNYWYSGYEVPYRGGYWLNLLYIETGSIKRFFASGELATGLWGAAYKNVNQLPQIMPTRTPTPTPTRTPTPTPTATTPIPYSHTNLPPLTPGDRLLGSPTGTESGVFYRPNVQYSINYPYPVPDQVVSGRTVSVTVYGLPSGVSVVGTAAPVGQALKSGYPVLYIQGDALNGVTERFLIVYRNSYNGTNYTTYIKGALRPI
jgi:hypothetical protein